MLSREMSSAEIIEGRSMRIRRDETSSDEVLRAHVEAAKGANGGPLHIHLRQEERFIVDRGMLLVRRGRERIHVGPGEDVRIPAKVRHTFEQLCGPISIRSPMVEGSRSQAFAAHLLPSQPVVDS
jgi:mannose-6-phosphate isomerase-like protein (cupin superfamily)